MLCVYAMLGVALIRQTCRRGAAVISAHRVGFFPRKAFCSRQLSISAASLSTKGLPDVNKKIAGDVEDYQIIYKFPYIVLARAICRLKIYQTAVCGFAVPAVGYLAYNGVLDTQVFASTAAVGGLAFVMLFVMGEIFRRTVGHIYYNARKDIVKVSHLSFWGNRKDIFIPVEDLVPITDTSDIPSDIYVHLLRFSKPKDSLYLFLRFGGIRDTEKFTYALGLLKPEDQLSEQSKLD
ncbi:transmembrane protein 186-like isoform X1 [Penaeus indicus]|uniref:transmembrane protein 186-like isoform X1 n=2 Tax=Penaeus indicus TaxID=29960 RepID=UPI00300D3918